MKKKNAEKQTLTSLILSLASVVLCCIMLAGTTFAWLTDEISSDNNYIEAGNLAIDFQMFKDEKYVSIANQESAIFSADGNGINWEPGKTEVVYLKLQNTGSLHLKYDFFLTVMDGGLADSLDYVIIEGDYSSVSKRFESWEDVKTVWEEQQNERSASTNVLQLKEGLLTVKKGELKPAGNAVGGDEQYIALAIHMREGVGNEFQGKTVSIDASVYATQASAEEDSFGADYDANATQDYVFMQKNDSFSEVWEKVPAGSILYLTEDITIPELNVDKSVIIDAAGHKIGITKGITLNESETLTLRNAKAETLKVNGTGTLILHSAKIIAEKEKTSAVHIASGEVNLNIKGYSELIGAKNGHGIYVEENATLKLSGNGKLVTKGNAGVESSYMSPEGDGGSGIAGKGNIEIKKMANLTAEGYGTAGFGIGGESKNIDIKDSVIEYAKGGYAEDDMLNDTKYGKSEPEGGAAIGSMTNGALISLNNVIVKKAEGGSKAAGIGARYHTSVTIYITNCTIENVVGGNASAAIGGSRIGNEESEKQDVTINIKDSKIKAQGGQFGAGIGSGYDTYCHVPEKSPLCTINISGTCEINATGGTYAAGIGTGFHAGGLAGKIENMDGIKAVSGKKSYKDTYTKAQDIGFGVLDLTRDGLNNICTFTYGGKTYGVPGL